MHECYEGLAGPKSLFIATSPAWNEVVRLAAATPFTEEYEARLSQARFDATLSVGESQLTPLDPAEEQRLRTQCWVVAAGPKCKGCLYGTGDLAHPYKCGDDSFMQHKQGSSSCTQDVVDIN
ncbi:hypothetical protein JHK85_053874 [Glycine max]|nr:hypothetical protein JHK85_053874 [Glycine max]